MTRVLLHPLAEHDVGAVHIGFVGQFDCSVQCEDVAAQLGETERSGSLEGDVHPCLLSRCEPAGEGVHETVTALVDHRVRILLNVDRECVDVRFDAPLEIGEDGIACGLVGKDGGDPGGGSTQQQLLERRQLEISEPFRGDGDQPRAAVRTEQ